VKNNFQNLEQIKTKEFDFDGYKIRVQFNSSRIVSSSAKVDKKTIENRACFLCKENLPDTQKGIMYKNDYIILINPFPIFKQHLTIPHLQHIPQSIENYFEDMLELSYDLKDNFFIFYNGPKCGASAPDHFHFQTGLKYSTPIETEYKSLVKSFGKEILNKGNSKAFSVNSPITKLFVLESKGKSELIKLFKNIFNQLKNNSVGDEEPLMNIISTYDNSRWKVFLYPRAKHRPQQFFAEDESQILFSPAAVDMAGLCITPREEDFNKIIKEDLTDMFGQVIANETELETIKV
ncbi:MAG: DUF4922 domain-containing protein, partial [Ignavibacteriae bacterium]|nr:DUF4922 domain-containing protein [Ignavibacteriota bacterium]